MIIASDFSVMESTLGQGQRCQSRGLQRLELIPWSTDEMILKPIDPLSRFWGLNRWENKPKWCQMMGFHSWFVAGIDFSTSNFRISFPERCPAATWGSRSWHPSDSWTMLLLAGRWYLATKGDRGHGKSTDISMEDLWINWSIAGWWFGTMEFYDFPKRIGKIIIPTDELIFSRGVGIPVYHQPDKLINWVFSIAMFDYKRVDLTYSLMLWSLCFVDFSGKNFATFSAGEPFTPNRWNLSQVLQCDHFLTGHPNFSRFTFWSTNRNETVVRPLSILQHELQENILYSFWTHCSVSDLDDSLLNELWLFPTLAAIFGLDWSAPLENHRKPMWAWPRYSDSD